ncbi:MAG: hypothetical protein AB7J34_24955 [Limisphaerales bacterium]
MISDLQIKLALQGVPDVQQGIQRVQASASQMGAAFSKLGTMAAASLAGAGAAIGAALVTFGKTGVEFNAAIEDQSAAFRTLLGSSEAVSKRLKELAQFAASTPFEFPELARASRVLQNITGDSLAAGSGFKMVGDVAALTGQRVEEIAVHIGRLFAGLRDGTAVGEPLSRLTELGAISGDVARRLGEMARAGTGAGRELAILQDAFQRSAGAMEERSATLSGRLSTLKDSIAQLAGVATKDIMGPLKRSVEAVTESADALRSLLGSESTGLIQKLLHAQRLLSLNGGVIAGAKVVLGGAAPANVSAAQARLASRTAPIGSDPGMGLTPLGPLPSANRLHEFSSVQRIGGFYLDEEESAIDLATAKRVTELMEERLRIQREMGDEAPEDAFWRQQAADDYRRMNEALVESQESAKRLGEAVRSMSYTGGTAEAFNRFQAAAAIDDAAGIGGGLTAGWQQAMMDLGTAAQQAGNMVRNTIGTAISSVSAGISGLVLGTQTWASALRQIGSSILNEVIQGMVKMFSTWIARRLAVSAVEKGAALGEAAAKAPGALMDSISSWGVAAAVGGAAFVAAMALSGGFKSGGFTGAGNDNQIAGVAHANEFVFNARAVRAAGLANLEAIHSNPRLIPMLADSARASGNGRTFTPERTGSPAGPVGGRSGVTLNAYFDRRAWVEASRDDIEAVAVDVFNRMRG